MDELNEQFDFLERIKNSNSFVSENNNDEYLLKKYSNCIILPNNKPFITGHGETHYDRIKLSSTGELELERLKNQY